MNRIVEELKKTGVFYVATQDGDQPTVRPFSSAVEFEGSLYICTNNTKEVYKQMLANPRIAISGMQKDGHWIRIIAKAVRDDRDEARAAMLADPSGPSQLYKLGDGLFEVLRLEEVVCVKYTMQGEKEGIE